MNQTYLKIPSLLLACAFLLGMLPGSLCSGNPGGNSKHRTGSVYRPNRRNDNARGKKKWRQGPLLHWKLHRSLRMGSLSLQKMFPQIGKQQRMLSARRHL